MAVIKNKWTVKEKKKVKPSQSVTPSFTPTKVTFSNMLKTLRGVRK